MSILGFLFLVFALYLAYRLVFDFIIPVVRTTRRLKKGFREMNERMNQHTGQYQEDHSGQTETDGKKGGVGEYIDFEEVKD